MRDLEVLSVVALLDEAPLHGLRSGQVGTVVERLRDGAYEVDFSDEEGRTYALVALRDEQLLRLWHGRHLQAA